VFNRNGDKLLLEVSDKYICSILTLVSSQSCTDRQRVHDEARADWCSWSKRPLSHADRVRQLTCKFSCSLLLICVDLQYIQNPLWCIFSCCRGCTESPYRVQGLGSSLSRSLVETSLNYFCIWSAALSFIIGSHHVLSIDPLTNEIFKCRPNKGAVPPRFGAGPQFSYSGWSSMKTLVDKSLVVKKNCPAK
jgi:hypothetical protein